MSVLDKFGLNDYVSVYLPQSYNFAGNVLLKTAEGVADFMFERLGENIPEMSDTFEKYEEEVERYRGGETKLMGFFVGQVMKRSKGQADPKGVQPVIAKQLEK